MDTNNDINNVLEGGGSAADHLDHTLRHTNQNTNDKFDGDLKLLESLAMRRN